MYLAINSFYFSLLHFKIFCEKYLLDKKNTSSLNNCPFLKCLMSQKQKQKLKKSRGCYIKSASLIRALILLSVQPHWQASHVLKQLTYLLHSAPPVFSSSTSFTSSLPPSWCSSFTIWNSLLDHTSVGNTLLLSVKFQTHQNISHILTYYTDLFCT